MQKSASVASTGRLVEVDVTQSGIARLTLNRPTARNALSLALMGELHDQLEAAAKTTRIRVIVLGASGSVFSSGHDLKEMTAHRADEDGGRAFFRRTMDACASLMLAIVKCPKPVIAAVQGRATAAGCQLVASCDLAIAAETADFATPGVDIGLFCSTPMVAVSRSIGRKRAMEMLFTGEPVSAAEAVRIGLINRAVPPEALAAEVTKLASAISSKSKRTLAIGKEAFYRQIEMPLAEAYAYAAQVMVENMLTADAEEGIAAFIEKRRPQWKDR